MTRTSLPSLQIYQMRRYDTVARDAIPDTEQDTVPLLARHLELIAMRGLMPLLPASPHEDADLTELFASLRIDETGQA